MKNVKIIVLRKGFYPDLIREHQIGRASCRERV